MTYRYTARDLMAAPERYFYTALEGPGFLPTYLAARRGALHALPEQAHIALPFAPAGRIASMTALTDPPEAVLDRFARRFEITRKIHVLYDEELRRGEGGTDDPAPYARLARVLSEQYRVTGHLRDLNTLLKLGDLLASLPPATLSPCADDTRAAWQGEMAAVTALAQTKGLTDVT